MRRVDDRIRTAASLIAAREGDDEPEVLVLERGGQSRFLPGYVAFPGGSVDEEDAGLAERLFGTAEEAARACALRELIEEVTLVLTAEGLTEADDLAEPGGDRDAATTRGLERMLATPPSPAMLPEVAHWIAPPEVPVRFDARYFAAASPGGLRAEPDGDETADAWWSSPRVLLEDWEAGRRLLYWPTYFTLRALAGCSSAAEILALRLETREPDDDELERLPRSTFWQD